RRAQKGECILYREDLLAHIDGLELVVMESSSWEHPSPPFLRKGVLAAARQDGPAQDPRAPQAGIRLVANAEKNDLLALLREAAQGRVRLAATMLYRGNDRTRLARPAVTARPAGVPLIAVNDGLSHHPARR